MCGEAQTIYNRLSITVLHSPYLYCVTQKSLHLIVIQYLQTNKNQAWDVNIEISIIDW